MRSLVTVILAAFTIVLALGCGNATSPPVAASGAAPSGEPSTSPTVGTSEDDARTQACADAATSLAPDAPPKLAMQTIVRGCLGIYREQGCKDAMSLAVDDKTDPTQRVRIMSDGCRTAYCPKLPSPPRFCSAPADADMATRSEQYPELTQAIILFEVGPANAKRIHDAFEAAEARRAAAH